MLQLPVWSSQRGAAVPCEAQQQQEQQQILVASSFIAELLKPVLGRQSFVMSGSAYDFHFAAALIFLAAAAAAAAAAAIVECQQLCAAASG